MNAFFYPLKRGFYFAEIQGGKVTAYILLAGTLPLLLVLLGGTLSLPLADFHLVIDDCVGHHSDKTPLIYGGATFEIKTLS